MPASGPLTFATSAVADNTGSATLKLQFGSNVPGGAWGKVNVIVDVTGSASCQLVADTITLDQAGGPQPQLGPVLFTANQNVSVIVTGAQPGSQVVAHASGVWATDPSMLQAVGPLSGGSIGAQQLIGTPFQENQVNTVAPSGTYTSPIYPMLGYSAILVQFIAAGVSVEPTVTLQWLDTSTPPVQLYQSNWQSQKEIDLVQAWGQQLRVVVQNNDTSTLSLTLMIVPIAATPSHKAAILTYKQTATNELLGMHNTAIANSGGSATVSTAAGLGYAGPAAIWLDWGVAFAASANANFGLAITYGPLGTSRTLIELNEYCPNMVGLQVDLPNQPMQATLTNNSDLASVTPSFGILAAYR